MKYYIEIDERDIDRFRIDTPCKGSHGNDVLVLEDKYHGTIGFELLKERPHGEWIETYYSIDGVGASRFRCSKCEKEISTYGEPYKFCPNCGASMVKEGELNES